MRKHQEQCKTGLPFRGLGKQDIKGKWDQKVVVVRRTSGCALVPPPCWAGTELGAQDSAQMAFGGLQGGAIPAGTRPGHCQGSSPAEEQLQVLCQVVSLPLLLALLAVPWLFSASLQASVPTDIPLTLLLLRLSQPRSLSCPSQETLPVP